ncbi:MAG: hypothetical protein AAFR52_06075 [Pseudomonadota bacterium]
MKQILGAAAVAVLASATVAQSSVVFAFNESGSDLVGVLSGTLDLTGAAVSQPGLADTVFDAFLRPNEAFLVAGGGTFDFIGYEISGPSAIGSGLQANGSYTGDLFTIDGLTLDLRLDQSFTGGALSGTLTLPGTTIADLGLTGDTFVWTLTNDETVTVTFGLGPG